MTKVRAELLDGAHGEAVVAVSDVIAAVDDVAVRAQWNTVDQAVHKE